MFSGTAKTFSLHVRCRYGDHDDWITLQSRVESLEQLLASPCGFECPTHGAQREFPLEGVEKQSSTSATQKGSPLFSPGKTAKPGRSSERKAFSVPVIVYGWSKSFGTFHESTTTLMFNASGALVRLVTPVEIGENLFIVNKFTKDELEVRVVFKDSHYNGGFDVGLAFAKPAINFWRKTRRSSRAPQTLRVVVRGKDRNLANTTPLVFNKTLFALREDSPPIAMDPITLETHGNWDFAGTFRWPTFTAHPKRDPVTGQWIAFGYSARGMYSRDTVYYEISADGRVTHEVEFEVPYYCMLHDFGVTEHYAVFPIIPQCGVGEEALKAGKPITRGIRRKRSTSASCRAVGARAICAGSRRRISSART